MLSEILTATKSEGWSTDNLAFGSGGGLLPETESRHFEVRFQCASVIDGAKRDVFQRRVDPGKQSKRGRLALVRRSGQLVTVQESECRQDETNELVEVFRDGTIRIRIEL